MQVYRGTLALSEFRTVKLLTKLQAIDSSITGLSAEFIHLVDIDDRLSATDERRLQELTAYGTPFTATSQDGLYFVVPRPGTISPWSSKATDIVHNSGLVSVKRVERGIAYYVAGSETKNRQAIADALHEIGRAHV